VFLSLKHLINLNTFSPGVITRFFF